MPIDDADFDKSCGVGMSVDAARLRGVVIHSGMDRLQHHGGGAVRADCKLHDVRRHHWVGEPGAGHQRCEEHCRAAMGQYARGEEHRRESVQCQVWREGGGKAQGEGMCVLGFTRLSLINLLHSPGTKESSGTRESRSIYGRQFISKECLRGRIPWAAPQTRREPSDTTRVPRTAPGFHRRQGVHAIPARAQWLPPHRPLQGHLCQLWLRCAPRREVLFAVRRHESGGGRGAVL